MNCGLILLWRIVPSFFLMIGSLLLYFVISDCELLALKAEVVSTQQKAYAKGTFSNLNSQWSAFTLFCDYFKLDSLNVSSEHLALFAQFLSRTLRSYNTVVNYVSGVKTSLRFLGRQVPDTRDLYFALTLKGLKRVMARPIHQAAPITPEIILDIFKVVDLTSIQDVTVYSIILFGFSHVENFSDVSAI